MAYSLHPIGTLKSKVFGIIGIHLFILIHRNTRLSLLNIGLKDSGPLLQRSMANKVLAGYVTHMRDIYQRRTDAWFYGQ